ncbi:MAG: G-D-S-L family lipolytic protein [Synechococcales cyanobacterium T60_A2020_003]|nr:G-D-S-L family lipolytic protein [Synechococcales cyanobacterium T60_A2020_003]
MQTLIHPNYGRSPAVARLEPLRIVAIGDSLVYGFGDPEGGGWVERLRRHWMDPQSAGHILYNLGVRGDGVNQVSQRLEQEFRYRGELRHRVPDALILSFGINDSARVGKPTGRHLVPMDEFKQSLDALLDHAQALCPVLFVGMPPVDEHRMPFAEVLYYSHADQRQYKHVTKDACNLRGIPYLDIYDQWIAQGECWWRSRLSADGIHPNVAGYTSLLEAFMGWDAAAPWLQMPVQMVAS